MFLAKGYKGTYYLYYTDEITGKKRKVSTKSKQKVKANQFLRTFMSQEVNPVLAKQSVIDIRYLQKEVLNYVGYNLNRTTVKLYERCFNILLRTVSNKPIKFITIQDIEKYKEIRLNEVSRSTVNIDLRTIKAIFNLAVKWKWLNSNPVNGVKLLNIAQKDILCFNKEEINIVFNSISNTSIKNIVKFALYTGCRINEILNIQFKDVNLVDKIITIRNKADFKIKNGKIRYIPISEKLYDILDNLFKQDGNIFNLHYSEQYLFHKNGFKYNKDYVSKNFKKALRKAKLPEKFHFHCLRHTFISNLIKKGVNINYVKELAGHSDISTTMHYIHISTEDLRDAVNRI